MATFQPAKIHSDYYPVLCRPIRMMQTALFDGIAMSVSLVVVDERLGRVGSGRGGGDGCGGRGAAAAAVTAAAATAATAAAAAAVAAAEEEKVDAVIRKFILWGLADRKFSIQSLSVE